MSRQTSIDVYNQIKNNGLLSNLRFTVYECIFNNGPITQAEASRLIGNFGENQGITPRFAELKRLGVIVEVGKRPCKISGRTVYEWAVTGNLPVEVDSKMSNKEKIGFLTATIKSAVQALYESGLVKTASELERHLKIAEGA